MPFSEVDVLCCIKCITKCRECHAMQWSRRNVLHKVYYEMQGVSCMQFILVSSHLSTVLNFAGKCIPAWKC